MPNPTDTDRRKNLDKEMSSYISFLRKKEKKGLKGIIKALKGKKKKSSADLHPEVETYGEGKKKKSKHEEEKEEREMEKEFEEGAKPRTFWGWLKERLVFEKEPEESLADTEEGHYEEIKTEERAEEGPEDELEEEYSEEVQKEGWISSIINRVFVKSREEEELEEVSDELAEDVQDMKAIAEITTNVMKMLPPEKMKELKQSEEFQQFKEILKKRNLIK